MEMSMTCLMVLLVVMGACILWKYVLVKHEGYVAVMTIVGLFQQADLSELVVHDGFVTGDGECRDVAI